MSVKKMTLLSLFTALSLAVYAIESLIPPLIPLPGMKLGLANIVTLAVLYRYRSLDSLAVLCCRILLSALLFGQALSLLYSMAGGLVSLGVMALVTRLLGKKRSFLTGAFGGLSHNLGQLAVAYVITSTGGVLAYLPFLVLSGVLTGLFTGFCAGFLDRYLNKHLPS